MSSVEQIAASALGLPEADRTRLIVKLLESLDDATPDSDVEQAWEAEVARRVRDLVEGRAKTIPADQAIHAARDTLARQR